MFLMLEKIYSELQGVKGEVGGLKSEVEDFKSEVEDLKSEVKENSQRLTGVETRLTKLETKVENEVVTKINSLFDGYLQNTEAINRVEGKVDHLTEKVEKQELEIRVIKGGK
ncbi:hypothetical protein BJL90_06200 [Clostridium formicaceticum]|nr:hypothetical protein BJL90_06200 [Clostridium formicaceticum]